MGLIRLLLAISVVLAHSSPVFGLGLVGGAAAVQIFYMISGFYMALVLNEKYAGAKGVYARFLGSRLLRLFPVYLAVVAATIIAQVLFPNAFPKPHDTASLWVRYGPDMHLGTAVLLGVANLLLVGNDIVYFMGFDAWSGSLYPTAAFGNEPMPAHLFLFAPQAWSLEVELLFYVVAPFIVRRRTRVLAGLLALSVAVRLTLFACYGLVNDPWSYRFFPSELAFFLTGSLGYRLHVYMRENGFNARFASATAFWAMIVTILLYSFVSIPGKRLVIYAIAACAIPLVFERTQGSVWDRYLGEICYPVYISHVLLAAILKGYGVNWGIVLVPITIGVSIVLYEALGRPVDSFRHRLCAKEPSAGVKCSVANLEGDQAVGAVSGNTGR